MVIEDLGHEREDRVLPVVDHVGHEVIWADLVGEVDFSWLCLHAKTTKEHLYVFVCLAAAVHTGIKDVIRVVNRLFTYRALVLIIFEFDFYKRLF